MKYTNRGQINFVMMKWFRSPDNIRLMISLVFHENSLIHWFRKWDGDEIVRYRGPSIASDAYICISLRFDWVEFLKKARARYVGAAEPETVPLGFPALPARRFIVFFIGTCGHRGRTPQLRGLDGRKKPPDIVIAAGQTANCPCRSAFIFPRTKKVNLSECRGVGAVNRLAATLSLMRLV